MIIFHYSLGSPMLLYNIMAQVRHAGRNVLMEGKTGWAVGTLHQEGERISHLCIISVTCDMHSRTKLLVTNKLP